VEIQRLYQARRGTPSSSDEAKGVSNQLSSHRHTKFPSGIAEQLRAYVYALSDPESGRIFYIGKGNGDRVFAHANGTLEEEGISLKNDVILDIKRRGLDVKVHIIQHGLDDHEKSDQSHAHQTESALFGVLKLIDPNLDNDSFSLSNVVAPPTFRDFGLRTVEEVIAQYGEPADVSQIPHSSVLIKPTRSWYMGMEQDELYEMTRGWWRMSLDRSSKVKYVFSIPRFIIRAVYEVQPGDWRFRVKGDRHWENDIGKKPRVGFDGKDVSAHFSGLINKSVEHVFGPGQGKRADFKYLDDMAVAHLHRQGLQPWWNAGS
jgi:hypothetical protein